MKLQKIKRRGARGWMLLLPLLLLSMASCVKEPAVTTLPDLPEGMVRIDLYTNSADYQKPVTRATNEYSVYGEDHMPWVFVFDAVTEAYLESAQAELAGGQLYVTLTARTSPVAVVVLANAPTRFSDGTADYDFNPTGIAAFFAANGNNITAVETKMQTVAVSATNVLPYNSGYLIMYGTTTLSEVSTTTTIGSSGSLLFLDRFVAKVTIENEAANFTFKSWTVINVNDRQGVAEETDYGSTISFNPDIAAPADIFYVHYTNKTKKPAVIVKGTYEGKDYWYKLAFRYESGEAFTVYANWWYKFKIETVAGPGFGSFTEAEAGPPSNNITAKVDVIDLSSHDIIDNGEYYLGVSNSEFIAYSDDALTGIVAVTISTNATEDMIGDLGTNSVTIAITGGTGTLTLSASLLTLSSGTTDTETILTFSSFPATVTSGTITLKLGNLQKEIKVTRRAQLGFGASAMEFSQAAGFSDDFSAGKIESQGDGGDGWLSLSLDGETPAPGSEVTRLDQAGKLYLMASKNIKSGATGDVAAVRTGGIAYLSRQNQSGRVKLYVAQNYLNTGSIGNNGMITNVNAYVGAFWRWDQTGERVIRIGSYNYSSATYANANAGAWTATVIEGEDWIKLAAGFHKDGSKTYPLAGDAENFQVEGNATSVSGVHTVSGTTPIEPILFRIGLKSKLTDDEQAGEGGTATPRYGLILLTYNNNKKNHKIYVRQGEGADYVMRPGDPNGSGTAVADNRSYAVKFSPYNLTSQTVPAAAGTQIAQRSSISGTGGTGGGKFVDYPSQAGAFFQWAGTSGKERYAFHPTDPPGDVSGWSSSCALGHWNILGETHETCPPDYRRPTDGTISGNNNDGFVASSEMRQSLWLYPVSYTNSNLDNSVFGYYADGFFDRGVITNAAGTYGVKDTAVSPSGADAAYAGRMFYNPFTNASLFLPAAGFRRDNTGLLYEAGARHYYWGSTSRSADTGWMISGYQKSAPMFFYNKANGYPVRCARL